MPSSTNVGGLPASCRSAATWLSARAKAGAVDLAEVHCAHYKGSPAARLAAETLCCNASCLHELLQTNQ